MVFLMRIFEILNLRADVSKDVVITAAMGKIAKLENKVTDLEAEAASLREEVEALKSVANKSRREYRDFAEIVWPR